MSSRILVTGGSGFVGSAVTSGLAQAGDRVRTASRKQTAIAEILGVEWMKLPDLEREVDWAPLLDGVDCVVHLAASSHRSFSKDDSDSDYKDNRAAIASLLQACAKHGIKRLIFMSSISAQAGSAADYIVTEKEEPRPITAYDRAKLAAEEEIRGSGVPFTILRPVLIYGPGAKGNIARMMRIASLPLPLPLGAFSNRRSLLSIENLVQAVKFCLHNPATLNRTFIVCDPEPLTLAEIISTLREASGRPANLIRVPPTVIRALITAAGHKSLWDRIGRELVANSGELHKLGWSPHVETRAGLAAMVKAAMLLPATTLGS